MGQDDRNRSFAEIKRCLAEADRAFALAGEMSDERERVALIEEAETWLVLAERRLAHITDRHAEHWQSSSPPAEDRSFGPADRPARGLLWRRPPHA